MVQERCGSLKQAPMTVGGYTVHCRPALQSTSSPPVAVQLRHYSLHSNADAARVSSSSSDLQCYDVQVQQSLSTTKPRHHAANFKHKTLSRNTTRCRRHHEIVTSWPAVRKNNGLDSLNATSGLCTKYRQNAYDDNAANGQTEGNAGTGVSAADICNCSPTFGARQPRLTQSMTTHGRTDGNDETSCASLQAATTRRDTSTTTFKLGAIASTSQV